MNKNTIQEQISLKYNKLESSSNAHEKALLLDEINNLKKELQKIEDNNHKDFKLTTNNAAPIIGDRKNNSNSSRPGQILPTGDTFISMI